MQEQLLDLIGLKILVVDNDVDCQVLYACLLESVGAAVMTVGSVCEAFATLTQFAPDILISEIALPKEDGYDFLRQLRALEAESGQFLPAIAVSAYVQGNDDLLALAAGFQKWIPKPVDIDRFVNTISQVAQQKRRDLCGIRENSIAV